MSRTAETEKTVRRRAAIAAVAFAGVLATAMASGNAELDPEPARYVAPVEVPAGS